MTSTYVGLNDRYMGGDPADRVYVKHYQC